MSDPESDLMLRVKAGEEGAFARLVARLLRPLVSFFHRLGADPSTAEGERHLLDAATDAGVRS